MLRHNLLLIFRNFKRFKSTFFINLIGLSSGLACALLIYLWVNDELNFDKFHANDAQLFQVIERSEENGQVIIHEATQGPLAEAMAKDLPEVVSAVSVMSLAREGISLTMKNGEKTAKPTGIFASRSFFEVFSFPLTAGNPKQVFSDRNAIVISEVLAQNLFGTVEQALGKSIEWEVMGMKRQSAVAGVFEPLPANNTMDFDFVLTQELLLNEIWTNGQKWWNEGPQTYLLLKKGTGINQFNAKIANFIKPYFPETIFTLSARPYSSAYLYGNYENGVQSGGRIDYVRLFSLIALFVLVIACINFMNLSTAKASRRQKEVGIKKAIGSTRGTLIAQFLGEAICMALLSLVGAFGLAALLLSQFNSLTDKQLSLDFSPALIGAALGVTLLTGFLSGSYPAFYLSRFKPASVLKGQIKNSFGEVLARNGLVVFQFAISLILIVGVTVIYQQIEYVQSKNLGYDKANILYFDKEGKVSQTPEDFLAAMKKIPGVVNASAIQHNIMGGGASTYGIEWPGKSDKDLIDFTVRAVDFEMIETFGISIKEGRSFSKDYGAEDSKLIFNETAIKVMGLKDPVGTPVRMWGEDKTIIGVVKDFHIASLHEPIAPMVFMYRPENTTMIMAKIEAGREKETIDQLQQFYTAYNPGYVFNFKFLDDEYQALYLSEQRISKLSRYFAGLAVLISCLGLFGLAAFTAEQRTKEIGIRKVLGASVASVVGLLSKEFLKLVFIALAIATPLAWFFMQKWLSGFAYRIELEWWTFALAGLAAILIAFFTVGYQSIKAAVANPVRSLRSE
ncbi:MAG: ABC transporter permease [Saprospiraceae bacterium]